MPCSENIASNCEVSESAVCQCLMIVLLKDQSASCALRDVVLTSWRRLVGYHTVAQCTRKYSFIYALKKAAAHLAPIFTQLKNVRQRYAHLLRRRSRRPGSEYDSKTEISFLP
jgi:hypothetical protein